MVRTFLGQQKLFTPRNRDWLLSQTGNYFDA